MATLTYGTVTVDLPAFKLREVKAAAPYIDRVLAERRNMATDGVETTVERSNVLETMTNTLSDVLCVCAIGVLKARMEFPYTPNKIRQIADEIEAELGMDEITPLNTVFDEILRESGMVRSNPIPGRPDTTEAEASLSASTESLPNSSQPDAPEGTGTE